jgi:DNA polymerase-3 subunit delta'
MTSVVGNERLRRRLCDDILAGTLSHAYIISGPKGSGKHTVAFMCVAALECENRGKSGYPLPCTECPSCRKILEKKSPDIFTIEKNGASVKIDQIRELQSTVRITPNELEKKIYIIEDSHTMTPQAQNALLLTLEEPPSYIIFFLLCESEEKLLETVKSRAPLLRTEPISQEKIREYLLTHSSEAKRLASTRPEELDAVISIANGSIGRALELIDEKARQPFIKQRQTAEQFIKLALSKSTAPLVELMLSLPQKQDELLPILNCAQTALRDLILLKKSEDAMLCFYSQREQAIETSYSTSLSSILSLYDKIEKTKETLTRNANIKLALTALLANIQ